MGRVGLVYHPAYLEHDMGGGASGVSGTPSGYSVSIGVFRDVGSAHPRRASSGS